MGKKKSTFRDKNIEEIYPFPQQRRGMFCFKNYTFNLEIGHFLGVGILGEQTPPPPQPPDSTAFDCAPSGAMRKVHGGQFPRSAVVYIRALMWRAKCPIKA